MSSLKVLSLAVSNSIGPELTPISLIGENILLVDEARGLKICGLADEGFQTRGFGYSSQVAGFQGKDICVDVEGNFVCVYRNELSEVGFKKVVVASQERRADKDEQRILVDGVVVCIKEGRHGIFVEAVFDNSETYTTSGRPVGENSYVSIGRGKCLEVFGKAGRVSTLELESEIRGIGSSVPLETGKIHLVPLLCFGSPSDEWELRMVRMDEKGVCSDPATFEANALAPEDWRRGDFPYDCVTLWTARNHDGYIIIGHPRCSYAMVFREEYGRLEVYNDYFDLRDDDRQLELCGLCGAVPYECVSGQAFLLAMTHGHVVIATVAPSYDSSASSEPAEEPVEEQFYSARPLVSAISHDVEKVGSPNPCPRVPSDNLIELEQAGLKAIEGEDGTVHEVWKLTMKVLRDIEQDLKDSPAKALVPLEDELRDRLNIELIAVGKELSVNKNAALLQKMKQIGDVRLPQIEARLGLLANQQDQILSSMQCGEGQQPALIQLLTIEEQRLFSRLHKISKDLESLRSRLKLKGGEDNGGKKWVGKDDGGSSSVDATPFPKVIKMPEYYCCPDRKEVDGDRKQTDKYQVSRIMSGYLTKLHSNLE